MSDKALSRTSWGQEDSKRELKSATQAPGKEGGDGGGEKPGSPSEPLMHGIRKHDLLYV